MLRAGARPTLAVRRTFLRGLSSAAAPPFDKILIANRGEIACRVIRTARRLGVKTVAVYSQPEARARHVQMADEAYCVGEAASSDSYLNIERIIEVMKQTGAQAVHPGYGFLSENAHFAEEVEKIGASFVGPPSSAIHAMGDKIESKQIGIDAKINTIPGFQGVIHGEDEAVKVARDIGYPVMIKASAGGGGKGMRIAYDDDEAREGYRLSSEEARKSFGDDRLFIEKFIEEPHHIEIQLIADKHGNVACFPERECSIQRRNQKVLEESPSALLTPETRALMCEQATMLAKAVGYHSAGTIEFLADNKQNFYFLEMNTRLQVEHPVSEYVGGVDLVEQMLRVAAGHPLPEKLTTEHLTSNIKGWALEARVYAEDPIRGFLPSNGSLLDYKEPEGATSFDISKPVRVDSGLQEGMEISTHYDPMIAKLVTHGETRDACIDRMEEALNAYVIKGTPNFAHNASFLHDLCRHPRFRAAETPTSFIAEEYPNGFMGVKLADDERRHAATAAALIHAEKQLISFVSGGGLANENFLEVSEEGGEDRNWVVTLEDHCPGAKQTANAKVSFRVEILSLEEFSDELSIRVTEVDEWGSAVEGGTSTSLSLEQWNWDMEQPLIDVVMDDKRRTMQYHGPVGSSNFCAYYLALNGSTMRATVKSSSEAAASKHMLPPEVKDLSNMIVSPMPGLLISVAVADGQTVEMGQEVAVVEAMKMQNVLRAPRAGVINTVKAKPGDSLNVEQVIATMEAEEGELAA